MSFYWHKGSFSWFAFILMTSYIHGHYYWWCADKWSFIMTVHTRLYKFTLEQRVWLLTAYYKQSGDYKTIFEEFVVKFPNVPMPSRQMVSNMHNKFQWMVPVSDALRSGRPRTMHMLENYERVAQAMVEDHTRFSKRTELELDLTRRLLYHTIKELGFCL